MIANEPHSSIPAKNNDPPQAGKGKRKVRVEGKKAKGERATESSEQDKQPENRYRSSRRRADRRHDRQNGNSSDRRSRNHRVSAGFDSHS